MASEPTLSSLAMLASSVDRSDASMSAVSPAQKTKEQVRRHYVRALHKVIDESGVIILVLDARDPEGCQVDSSKGRFGDGRARERNSCSS